MSIAVSDSWDRPALCEDGLTPRYEITERPYKRSLDAFVHSFDPNLDGVVLFEPSCS